MKKIITLEKREKEIIELLEIKDENARKAFEKLFVHYWVSDKKNYKNHVMLIFSVYYDRPAHTKWRIANDCHIGERTAFRYRREYVDTFWACFNNLSEFDELAVTIL